ncbi:MAG TPA: copper resistance protein CopC [Burkholderiaceae bacterium]
MKKALTLALLATTATLAFAHARLKSSTPADGASVSPAPQVLRLEYGEPVELAMSSVTLTGPAGAAVATARVAADPRDDRALVLALPRLAPGGYQVRWATMGRDGHHTRGEIRFTVK